VIYEESKMIWIYQKSLFPAMVINVDNYESIKNDILIEEYDEVLRMKIKAEIEGLMEGITYHLNKENREKFGNNFTRFKNNLASFN
jgi:hypothetical protein